MSDIIKYWPLALILFGAVITATGTYIAGKRDSRQQDTIQGLAEVNKNLGEINIQLGQKNKEIGNNLTTLSNISNELATRSQVMIKENNEITNKIYKLDAITNNLTEESKKIVEENRKLAEINIDLTKQNQELGKQALALTGVVRDLNTGGNSYPDLSSFQITNYKAGVQSGGNLLQISFSLLNAGEYAIDGLKVKGFDAGDFTNTPPVALYQQLSMSGLNIHSRYPTMQGFMQEIYQSKNPPVIENAIDVFKPGQRVLINPIGYNGVIQYGGVNIFVESKRQDWIILLRYYNKNYPAAGEQNIVKAYMILKVTGKGLEIVKEYVEEGFQKFDWFSTPMPQEWFVQKDRYRNE